MEKRFIESPEITVNERTCSKCGLCIRICPVRIFRATNEYPISATNTHHPEECVLCGQCLSACSTNSIMHSGFIVDNFKRIQNRKPITPEVAFEFLSQRRSVRNYKNEVPSSELLERIINIAGYAPGSPHHRVGWVRNMNVVSGSGNMKVIADMTAEYMQKIHSVLTSRMIKIVARFSESARAGLGVVPDLEMRLNEYRKGRDHIIYNAPVAIFAYAPVKSSTPQTDCVTALLMIQLFAESNGLGTCWNGLIQGAAAGDHLQGFTKLAEFLKIPEGHKCYAAMTAGFPSINLHSIPERKVDITWINESKN
jgi:NAD-dependent dihydropyrimidine dehydrogenase PreA subunit/nitroreductase